MAPNWNNSVFRKTFDPLRNEIGDLSLMRKSARMTAWIALAFAILSILLLTASVFSYGISPSTPLITGVILMFLSIIWINALKIVYISSYMLCVLPSLTLMAITLYLKSKSPGDDLHYYDSRIILLGYCALSALVFSPREPYLLYSTTLINFLCVVLYDPIHEAFGLGYFQSGFTNPTYYHINTISILVSFGIVGCTLILKRIVVREEEKNRDLYEEIDSRNHELQTQNEEILSQTEQLSSAYSLIEKQKEQLEKYTFQLEELVRLKSMDLNKSIEELQKHNSELLQFSYTVSHNVRGPVARLLGLTSLIDSENSSMDEETRMIFGFLKDSASELDTVIRELSRIIDIRNDLYTAKEKVYFEEEWKHVMKSLDGTITPDMDFLVDFAEAPFIYTIRPFLHSVLYNLVSNAIRYRSPQRQLKVIVKTAMKVGKVNIIVADNGLGINLKQFGDNVFGMYKRFHTHVQGRGLGLFLVKTQLQALHGEISVESELNVGTTFNIDIRIPLDIEGQVCFDCDFGSVLYNARIDSMGLMWKRPVSSDEFRELLRRCLELLHVYRTARWIADLRKLESLSNEDYHWFATTIINEGSQMGLRTIGVISIERDRQELRTEISKACSKTGVEIKFFETRSEAESWIEAGRKIPIEA